MHSNQWDCFILYRQQITSNDFSSCLPKWAKTGFRLIEKDFEIKSWSCMFYFYCIKQIDSILPCVCSVIDQRGRQNVVRTSVTHSAIALCATFLFLPYFDVICDLLLNRRTATWTLFVKYFNPVDITKLTFYTPRRRTTTVSLETCPFTKNSSPITIVKILDEQIML